MSILLSIPIFKQLLILMVVVWKIAVLLKRKSEIVIWFLKWIIMNPIHQLMSIFCSCEKRKCPKCKNIQIVLADKKNEKVKCKYCGEIMPPKKSF